MAELQEIQARLPHRIAGLAELATDLWWASSAEARSLFRMISRRLWHETEHNPVELLRTISEARLAELAEHPTFLAYFDRIMDIFEHEHTRKDTYTEKNHKEFQGKTIAYFSAEYGLHTSLPIYSGGLGILAGDHVKTAGDLGLPLVAIGFLYPYGYFEQHIESDGTQLAEYRNLDFQNSPVERVQNADGSPLIVTIRLDNDPQLLHLQIWMVKVGRTTIYLMDSDLELNAQDDREITKRLYGGDKVYRLRQEIALGVGGVKTLEALGIEPDVWHANEGHAAFIFIERLRREMLKGVSFGDAVAKIRRSSIFTTHTPVPAGHDAFSFELITDYFAKTIEELGVSKDDFLLLGKHEEEWGEAFNMTSLAMNMTEYRNAVSKKHEEVTRSMWPEYDNVGSVTNGVHVPTWLAPEWNELFTTSLSGEWKKNLTDASYWQQIQAIPDELFWKIRDELNNDLRGFMVALLREQYIGTSDKELIVRGALFDTHAFTIGFARRFATYKRAALLFKDPERLSRILNRETMPAQIVFSGKAHPADKEGQELIRMIWEYANDPLFTGKVFFLENYSIHSAKYLVQGVDMWMNTPRKPLEASGTSGMKAAINGVPNFSVLDGWWIEGYNGKNGWAIDSDENLTPEEQDTQDVETIYSKLEEEIIPLYYRRDLSGIPHGWVKVAKEAMMTAIPNFTSERMMIEYIKKYYGKALR
jgi:glycogen phosphorylase